MAGTILLTENEGLAISTVEFDYLVERIRKEFMPQDESVVAVVYEPLDEGGMTFISAIDLNEDSFRAFARAVKRAYAMSMQETSFSAHKDRWLELLSMVEKDSRNDEQKNLDTH